MDVRIERARESDLGAVFALLELYQLPTAGLQAHLATVLIARDEWEIIGCAALEMYGEHALLRSVAVAPDLRGRRLGRRLVQAALLLARERGVASVYLLTDTASAFYPQFGFQPVARPDIPATVQTSVEFTSACPASALAMVAQVNEM